MNQNQNDQSSLIIYNKRDALRKDFEDLIVETKTSS
jgi:hypothetical protein